LDPTSPPTAATGPEVGIFQKYRSQLSAFVDLFTSTAATVAAGTTSPFDTQFISKSSDRTSDIIQTTPAPTLPLAQGLGFFTTSNTPGNLDEASFAVNANLLNGSKTVNRQAAQPIVNFFTAQNSNLGSATTPAGTTTVGGNSALGGLVLVTRTPQGIISGITQNFAANQARVKSLDVSQTTTQQDLTNRLSSRTGVSTDNELAQLQILQNQYAATGRLMSTADTMFQTLLGIGR
jgi:flagellar hook-associated protein 1